MLRTISWKGEIASEYYFWLCDSVGYLEEHEQVLQLLFSTEFTWTIDDDKNRAIDGLDLRRRFVEECSVRGQWDDGNPCSVLEMLVALAIRVEDDILGDDNYGFFWRMLENLGILEEDSEESMCHVLDIWLNRQFQWYGSGSVFPLNDADSKNQRRMSLWGQCMAWLNENI